jgi:hypothetical protein
VSFFREDAIPGLIRRCGGEAVTCGTASTLGLISVADEEYLIAAGITPIEGPVWRIEIKTGSLSGVAEGSAVGFRSLTRYVWKMRPAEDGGMTTLLCVAVL